MVSEQAHGGKKILPTLLAKLVPQYGGFSTRGSFTGQAGKFLSVSITV